MTIFKKLWTSFQNCMMDPPITPEILRKRYSEMSDAQLNTINENELTPMAAEAYKAELTSRKHKP